MDLAALERALAASKARPILVDPRLVRRVVKAHRHLPGIGLQVPHARCYAIGRDALLAIVRPKEIGRAAAELPEEVILLPRPDRGDERSTAAILQDLWRSAFHARVHAEMERLALAGALTPAVVREHVHRIGQTEFDEIRVVLREDSMLLATGEDLETYTEFVAVYLELQSFAPELVGETFPTLLEARGLAEAIAEDVDAARLLEETRPEGAVLPPRRRAGHAAEEAEESVEIVPPAPSAEEAARARELAQAARAKGNHARALAWHLEAGDGDEAAADADALALSLDRALRPANAKGDDGAEGIDRAAWSRALVGIGRGDARDGFFRRVSDRLLFDVQSAGMAGAKAIGKIDLAGWALSFGRRPFAKLLPATRELRVARELTNACAKIPRLDTTDEKRAKIRDLLADARRRADDAIRRALRGPVEDALREVGFHATCVPERVALAKLVDELLDQATSRGHLSVGQLRDAVSRNQLKMHDVRPAELVRGDALLAADRRLAGVIDGVHRRGEIYLRMLQKLSSLLFGTGVGRFITFFILLPVGGAYMVPFATQLVVTELGHLSHLMSHHHHVHLVPEPRHLLRADSGEIALMVATGVALFALIHSARARSAALAALRAVGFVLSAIFARIPRWFVSRPLVKRFLASRAARALGRVVLRPAIVAGVLYAAALRHEPEPLAISVAAAVFVVTSLLFNTSIGIVGIEVAEDAIARSLRQLQRHMLPGLLRLVGGIFRRFTDGLDRMIYMVDEWLRFREGQSKAALVAKAVLGVGWFAIAYVLRIYVNLLLEPTVNPLKHVPTVTVAAKIMLPIDKDIAESILAAAGAVVGESLAGLLAGLVVVSLPGFFGFLVWELKENYKLYEATRAPTLRPLAIGHHGETMGALLKPGFHSGTLPKLWQKLRRAANHGDASLEKHVEAMREVEEAVERFVDRELGALLATSDRFPGAVRVRRVALASNRVRVELARELDQPGGESSPYREGVAGEHATEADPGACAIAFEEQSGKLVASVAQAGWSARLTKDEALLFENALAGLYHRAGVELVREQLAAALPPASTYDVADEGLVVWPADYATELVYDLTARGALHAKVRGALPAASAPTLERTAIDFAEQPIAWTDWVEAWTKEPRRLVKGASLLPERLAGVAGAAT